VRPVLLLDVMDTLVHEPFQREVPGFFGLTLEELLSQKHPTAWVEYELGAIDEETLFARFFRDGRRIDGAGLKRVMAEAYRWLPGMEELLGELVRAGHELHALSNYPEWYRLIEQRLGLSRYLSWSFVSCLTGLRKPDPRAFTGAARALGVAPGQCLFVDDRETNCAAARATGMQAVRFTGARELRRALAARGLLGRQ
jgi:HAD superfamily hydrolase (TIGR01509 family)